MILGFPSNNFGEEEPGSDAEVHTFCTKNYGVTFPMFAKSDVTGENMNPLYRRLKEVTGNKPSWNFYKYLVDRTGKRVQCFESATEPDAPEVIRTIEEMI